MGKLVPHPRGDFGELSPLQKAKIQQGGNQEDIAFAGRRFIGQNRCQVDGRHGCQTAGRPQEVSRGRQGGYTDARRKAEL